jgi:hypothetical protein
MAFCTSLVLAFAGSTSAISILSTTDR